MADGPSTAVVTISVMGLAFDLIGAFLLSIPMVWSAKGAAQALRKFSLWLIIERQPYMFIVSCAYPCAFWGALIYGMYAGSDFFIWLAVFLLFHGFVSMFLHHFIYKASVSHHEERIGAMGLVLLSIGFILQFIVNMQWVH